MEASPRLPMLSFDLKVNTEPTQFGPQLKQYIAAFYHEDPEGYITEINNLESLRAAAVRPGMDVNGVLLLKKYYCQLHFLKSRFPMEENQDASVQFSWKDQQLEVNYSSNDIRFELMVIMYNIGALHSYLGATESRNNPEGMKLACTHFQCAAWAFQAVKEKYHQFVVCISLVQLVHFFQQVCLAQAQECILEKSMLDNRKATIIAKVAVQVHSYYRQSLSMLEANSEDLFRDKMYKEWIKYLQFKISYYKCVSLLFHGQQAEEQQKMGERVAYYQAACEQLEEAKKWSAALKTKQELNEGLAFTQDVVEGKRKAAKNENEFIYHEEVPDRDRLEEVKGASLVKGIPFSINDTEISGPDIFSRLVPMEAHEAASLYSEQKAQMLRHMGELIETKDQALVEFMSSLKLDLLTKMHQTAGLPQELIDRAASLAARPTATKDLVDAMAKLSNIYQDVESSLNEIEALLKEEEEAEKGYQELMGKRPPSIIATDLARETAKYKEAHNKANESNQTLHRAMMAHIANLKILQQPLMQLHEQLPSIELPNENIDEKSLNELEGLVSKVEEMRNQRTMLWAQLRESVHQDDITNSLVTKQPNQTLEQLFQQELEKHKQLTGLLEQNMAAQENIKSAVAEAYAKAADTRHFIQDILHKRESTLSALIASYDAYEDLLAKANKGIEFYNKLETNVSKLLQRIKSSCKVQQEEREQMLLKNDIPNPEIPVAAAAPKLKDFLESRKRNTVANYSDPPVQYPPVVNYSNMELPPGVRPAPLGSEITDTPFEPYGQQTNIPYGYNPAASPNKNSYLYQHPTEDDLANKMNNLLLSSKSRLASNQYNSQQYSYSSYIPQNYASTNYSYSTQPAPVPPVNLAVSYDPTKAYTTTTNSYRPLSSYALPNDTSTHMQYPDSSLGSINESAAISGYQYPNYSNSGHSQPSQIPIENTMQPNANVNIYYPTGYAPGYSASYNSTQTSQEPVQYHSVQYASSVQAEQQNHGYNATYSSPVVSLASAQAADANYLATGQYASPTALGTSNLQNIPASVANTASYSAPSTQSSTQAYTHYTGSQAYSNNASSGQDFPICSTYQSNNLEPSSTYPYYPGSFDKQPYAASLTNQNISSAYPNSVLGASGQDIKPQTVHQYSAVAQNPSYQQPVANTTGFPVTGIEPLSNNVTYGSYGSYYDQGYGAVVQNYPNTQQYVTQMQQQETAPAPVSNPAVTKQSNIDLLSGLDFTISQTPLIPQQNPSKPQEAVVKPTTSEEKATKAKSAPISKEEQPRVPEMKRPDVKILPSKLLNNSDTKRLFEQEIEKYEKYIETLTNKTLSGPTNLDIKWKEIQEKQDCEGQRKSISVARCYPMRNRFPDILPYDSSRVELVGSKDDYINASFIKDVSPYAPLFIVTQAPLSSTITEFWTMIKEQQVELIFCMMNDNELGDDVYWPREKGHNLNFSNMVISLKSVIIKSHWVERLISVNVPEKRETWVVMHLQFTSWPGSLFPTSPEPFISFILELISLFQQQRSVSNPVVVHCQAGIGRSGVLCLLTAAILDAANNANTIPDLTVLTLKLTNCQKNILRDREHLKFAHECFLAYMKQVLSLDKITKKLNDMVVKREEEVKPQPIEVVEKNPDPLSTLDPFWASKK